MEETEERVRLEKIRIPLWRRFGQWLRNIGRAFRDFPPAEDSRFRVVNPGDPGYENAPFQVGRSEISQQLMGNEFVRFHEYGDALEQGMIEER